MYAIHKKLTSINHTALKRTKDQILYIVIHYIGALSDALANATYYATSYAGASADFYVGHNGERWQGNDYYNYYSWHCGGNYQSSMTENGGGSLYQKCTNKNSIGIEMCVKKKNTATLNATDRDWYFTAETVDSTAQLVAELMKELGIDIEHVVMHYHVNRKICPNPFVYDINKWEAFKKEILKYYNGGTPVEKLYYRVRKSWDDPMSQLGAFEILDNAKANCPVGYSVYDDKGKVVYSNTEKRTGTQSIDFVPLSEQACANKILELARNDAKTSGILPSLTAAQAILESGYCRTTELVKKSNNCFGMKTTLSGNTWKSVWDGVSKVKIKTPEEYTPGIISYIYADFRAYPNIETSFADHSCYLLGAMNGSQKRYKGITECKNYKEIITLVKNGGYATDSKYIQKLCNIVERFALDRYDSEFVKKKEEPAPKAKDKYAVRRALKDTDTQIGLFSNLNNAKKLADERWGYNVYDIETNKPVYKPKLMNWQKVCASAIKLGEEMLIDLKNGHQWEYAGSGEKTFAKARKKGVYKVNCSGGVYWILCDTGILPDRSALNWYGTIGGIRWLSATAEADAKKVFDIIYVGNKTVSQCIKDGTLHPGDIITYMTISHTNMYLGKVGGVETSFDSGHNNCVGSGNGAKFTRWVSPLTCGWLKVAYIMRIKETSAPAEKTYRVQAGSYLIEDNANNMRAKLKSKGLDCNIVKVNGEFVCQLGLFTVKSNADALVKKAKEAGFDCICKEI